MNSNTKCRWPWAWRAAAALVATAQLLVPMVAVAQSTSANTVIQSQASASYVDLNGVAQVATSNIVQTTVQQVVGFTVSAGVNKSGGVGASVAVMHTITNTGNGSDTFTIEVKDNPADANQFASINVFADVNADGLADNNTSLVGGPVLPGAVGTSQAITIAEKQSYSYVVVYSMPPLASTPWTNTSLVTVTGGNTTINYPQQTQTVTDTIALTTQAAFNAQLTHSAPAVVAVGNGPWGATPSSGQQGTLTTYTLAYGNSGAADGHIYLRDELPAGITYQAGTAVWSGNAPGLALPETGLFGASPLDKIAFTVTGRVVEVLIKDVGVNSLGTVSFKVQVDPAASFGPLTSQALYSSESCGAATLDVANATVGCGIGQGVTSLSATFTVLPTRGVKLGPLADVNAGTAVSADTVTVASGVPGGTVSFSIPVANTGNAPESFKLPQAVPLGSFPSGTVFTWFHADGVTLLQNGGGSDVDTDPVAGGSSITVVLKAKLPANTTVASAVNLTTTVVARSSNDPAKLDAVNATLTNVVVGLVDVTSTPAGTANVDIGPGIGLNAVSQTLSVTAGGAGQTSFQAANPLAGSAAYDLYVGNHDSASLTFSLDSSLVPGFQSSNPPAGWTIRYYLFNTDVATSLTAAAVTSVTVAQGTQAHVLAVVTPLSTSSDVSALDIYFRARSTTVASDGAIISDQVRTQINVTAPATRGFVLSPAGGSQQVAPGGVAAFAHTVLNNGTQTCGVGGLKLTATISPAQSGSDPWKVVLYQDNGAVLGQIDGGDTLLPMDSQGNVMLPQLASGASYPLIARVYSPSSGVPGGSSVGVVLTVADQGATPNCGSQSITNGVSVAVGQLVVSKWQRQEISTTGSCAIVNTESSSAAVIDAKPSDCIVYRATVKNNGAAPVKNVSLHDTVPPFTTYHDNQPIVQCESTGLSGSVVALTPPGGGGALSCGSASNQLDPGGTITLRFRVRIN